MTFHSILFFLTIRMKRERVMIGFKPPHVFLPLFQNIDSQYAFFLAFYTFLCWQTAGNVRTTCMFCTFPACMQMINSSHFSSFSCPSSPPHLSFQRNFILLIINTKLSRLKVWFHVHHNNNFDSDREYFVSIEGIE